jgi:hypothetical protein
VKNVAEKSTAVAMIGSRAVQNREIRDFKLRRVQNNPAVASAARGR